MGKGFVRHIDDFKNVGKGYLITKDEAEVIESNVVIVKKGEVTPVGRHADEEEYYFVYTGEGLVTLNGVEQRVKKGDFIFIPRNCEHFSKGLSDVDYTFLCIAIYLDRQPSL
jgi:quercetin dioxygenase-like cupin family protein